ncbi:hypothetical protein [Algicola sagamiensis]|uniref:hypothetical protein n=1 Tax=Algicola sagamiensis TaxID=163869 RepID=UPI000381D8A1|nr:hypothetical protein [Algicola sagamiensis]
MTKINLNGLNSLKDHTDWERVEKQTDDEIKQAAISDRNAPLLPDHELSRFKTRKEMKHKLGF